MTNFGNAGEAFVAGGICAGNSPDVWGEMRAELPSEPQKVHVVTAAAIEEALGRLFSMPCVVADACDLLAVTPNKSLDLGGFAEKADGTLVVHNFAHAVRYLWGGTWALSTLWGKKERRDACDNTTSLSFSGREGLPRRDDSITTAACVSNRQRGFCKLFCSDVYGKAVRWN